MSIATTITEEREVDIGPYAHSDRLVYYLKLEQTMQYLWCELTDEEKVWIKARPTERMSR